MKVSKPFQRNSKATRRGSAARRHLALALGVIAFLGASCAPVVKYRQLKPAKFNLGKEPSFVLGKVEVQPRVDLTKAKGGGILGALAGAAGDMLQAFSGSDTLRRELETTMRSEIANNEFASYKVQGAKYSIDFSGELSVKDDDSKKEEDIKKEGKVVGKKVYYEVEREYDLDLRYSVTRAEDGSLVGTSAHRKKKTDKEKGDTAVEAAKQFDEWTDVGKDMLVGLVPPVMREILPYYTMEMRTLHKGKSGDVKEAGKTAKSGNFDGAAETWKKVLANPSGYAPEDKEAAYHNLGVYYETKDEVALAQESYGTCLKEIPSSKWCVKGQDRVKAREQELKRLQQSGL